jgi:alkanesulfonate monooxygenase SsuD/methylene tetrahydromethanopterin reductase-like flavin-dependent oxidoreductase (luciferase family)
MSQDSRTVRCGLWYDFRNPPQWRQASNRLYGEILEQIAWGELNGFDDVWMSEHHFIDDGYLPSILPVAAAIAARTKRIRIASGVLLMPLHNPVRLAEDIAVVDVISGGRFEFGVGIGFKLEEFASFGVPFKKRGARTNESLEIIRRVLAGESVTLKSAFFDFKTAITMIREFVRNVPITHYYAWTLPPGLPPQWAQAHLELFASKVIPAFR